MVDLLSALTATGESISLILVTVALFVFTYIAWTSKSPRSLQFQLGLVVVVLFLSEVPHILASLGLIDLGPYEDLGLELHGVSMFLITGFILYRFYGFLRRE